MKLHNTLRLVVLTVIFLCLMPMTAFAAPAIVVDDAPLNITNAPYIEDGRVMVEFRPIFEALDLAVDWNGQTKTVTATSNDTKIELVINKPEAKVNQQVSYLDVPALIKNGRTMVPVRFVSEASGAEVEWNHTEKTVRILTPEYDSLVSAFEKDVVYYTNIEREKQGLTPLRLDTHVSRVARLKSEDLRDQAYFAHESPTYGSPFDMMESFGIDYRMAGENIAAGQTTPEEVVRAWMNSTGHRENILTPEYTHIGVGYVYGGDYRHYWTQMFVTY